MIITPQKEPIATCTFEHGISRPYPGWAEHDGDKVWWGDFVRACRTLLQQSSVDPHKILAVGCSTFTPAILPVDSAGRPLRSGILYLDTRPIDDHIVEEFENLKISLGDEYRNNPASQFSYQITLTKILWLKRNEPEVFKNAAKFLCASSYILYRLTGNYIVDYGGGASRGLLYNSQAMAWDKVVCQEVGVNPEQLPRLALAPEKAGKLTAAAAVETGLPEGITVAVGTADAESTAISLGAFRKGRGIINYGTALGLGVCTDMEMHIPGLRMGRSPLSKDMYSIGGALSTGAGLTKWFKDNFSQAENELERQTGVSAYQSLSKIAGDIKPGSEGLIVLPYFNGERSPFMDPKARGMIFGLTLRHSRAHIYRAILEGVAFGARHVLDTIKEAGVTAESVVMVGGGSLSDVWTQIVSDVTQLKQRSPAAATGAQYGAAYLGGMAAGVIDLSFIDKPWDSYEKVVKPNPANKEIYDKHYQIYRSLYPKLVDEMHLLE